MGIKLWRNPSKKHEEIIYLGRSYVQGTKDKDCSKKPKWHQNFWSKFRREKKKLMKSASVRVTCHETNCYDEDTYSQNFDHGTGWQEPDNLPRSFSARYANPSVLLQRNASVRSSKQNFFERS